MKKTILSVILVLLLGWVLIGCEPPPEGEFDPNLPDDLKSFLGTSLTNAIKLPADTDFDGWWKSDDGKNFIIAWTEADDDKWTAYRSAWGKPKASINARGIAETADFISVLPVSGLSMATIQYYKEKSGTIDPTTFNVSENSIVFLGVKN